MKPAAREWVDKAEADFAAALVLRRSRKKHSRDIVCFHLQQCVEKYFKAVLVDEDIEFPRTHDLERLLELASSVEPALAIHRLAAAAISDYAVEIRYPGRSATATETRQLLKAAASLREALRDALEM